MKLCLTLFSGWDPEGNVNKTETNWKNNTNNYHERSDGKLGKLMLIHWLLRRAFGRFNLEDISSTCKLGDCRPAPIAISLKPLLIKELSLSIMNFLSKEWDNWLILWFKSNAMVICRLCFFSSFLIVKFFSSAEGSFL